MKIDNLNKSHAETILDRLGSLPEEARTLLIGDFSKAPDDLSPDEINNIISTIKEYEESWTCLSQDNGDGSKTVRIVSKSDGKDEPPELLTRNALGHPEWHLTNQRVGEKTKIYIETKVSSQNHDRIRN